MPSVLDDFRDWAAPAGSGSDKFADVRDWAQAAADPYDDQLGSFVAELGPRVREMRPDAANYYFRQKFKLENQSPDQRVKAEREFSRRQRIYKMAHAVAYEGGGRPDVSAAVYTKNLPKDDLPLFREAVEQLTKAKIEQHGAQGVASRIGGGFERGFGNLGQGLTDLTGTSGLSQEDLYQGQVSAAGREKHDPLVRPEDPMLAKAAIGAAEMAPEMAAVIGTTALTGGAGRMLGGALMGARGAAVGGAVGSAGGIQATATPRAIQDTYGMLRQAGIDEQSAGKYAGAVGPLVGAVEGILPNPIKGAFGQGIAKSLLNLGKRYGTELGEEALQQAIQEATVATATRLDETVADTSIRQHLQNTLDATIQAAGPLALTMGAGQVAQSGARAINQPPGPEFAPQDIQAQTQQAFDRGRVRGQYVAPRPRQPLPHDSALNQPRPSVARQSLRRQTQTPEQFQPGREQGMDEYIRRWTRTDPDRARRLATKPISRERFRQMAGIDERTSQPERESLRSSILDELSRIEEQSRPAAEPAAEPVASMPATAPPVAQEPPPVQPTIQTPPATAVPPAPLKSQPVPVGPEAAPTPTRQSIPEPFNSLADEDLRSAMENLGAIKKTGKKLNRTQLEDAYRKTLGKPTEKLYPAGKHESYVRPKPPAPPVKTLKPKSQSENLLEWVKDAGVENPTPSSAQTNADREVEKIFASFGKGVFWVAEPTGRFRGVTIHATTVALPSGRDGIDWNAVGDEMAHATGIDLNDYFTPEETQWARNYYLDHALTDQYAEELRRKPEQLDREARAQLVGKLFEDQGFRQRLFNEQPSLWRKIVDSILGFFRNKPVDSKEMNAVLADLRAARDKAESFSLKQEPERVAPKPKPIEDQPASQPDLIPDMWRDSLPGQGGLFETPAPAVEKVSRVVDEASGLRVVGEKQPEKTVKDFTKKKLRRKMAEGTTPKQLLDFAIQEHVGDDPKSQSIFREMIDEVYEQNREFYGEAISAWADIRKQTGLDQGKINRWGDAGKDYSSWPGPDATARSMASEHIGIGLPTPHGGGRDKTDYARLIWDKIREGAETLPPKHSPEVLAGAFRMFRANFPERLPNEDSAGEGIERGIAEGIEGAEGEGAQAGAGPGSAARGNQQRAREEGQEREAGVDDDPDAPRGDADMSDIPFAPAAAARPGARPDLANPARQEAVREMVGKVDTARSDRGEPEVRSDEAVDAEATARLADDEAGEYKRLLQTAKEGGQFGDTDTVVAKRIIDRHGALALQSGDSSRLHDAISFIDGYRRSGTEQARAFRQRRDPVTSPQKTRERQLVEAILTPPAVVEKSVRTHQQKGQHEQADKELDGWAQQIPEIQRRLGSLGVRFEDLGRIASNPVKAARTLGLIQTAKADKWDAAYEYWRNAILSGPATQSANVLGTVGNATWHYTAERFTEALANTAMGRQEGAQFGEFKHLLRGVLPGISRGARNFLKSWEAEIPFFEDEVSGQHVTKLEEPNISIKGKKGRIIRMPQRLLLAADEFLKSVIAQMEVGAQAYRMGKAEGLSGDRLAKRIDELSRDYRSPAWHAAVTQARSMAFQQEGGRAAQVAKGLALKARRDVWGLRYILPFVTTPINIFETALKKTPLGAISLGRQIMANQRAGRDLLHGTTPDIAAQVLSMAVLFALMGNDPDDPWITGNSDQKPYSIRIGDTWHSYSRLEPFATTIGLSVDWTNALKSPDPNQKIKAPIQSLVSQIKNKTFLSGMSDLIRAFDESDRSTETVARWSSGFAISWLPNIVRSGARGTDDEISERGVWGGDTQDWLKRLGKRTLQRTELGLVEDMPKFDIWGRRIEATKSPAPYTDWAYRVLAPGRNQPEQGFLGDRIILRWKNQHPADAEKFRIPPSKFYSDGSGKRIYMTDEQYARYAELSGELARGLVEAGGYDADEVSQEQIDRLSEDFEDARRIAKKLLVAEWTGGKKLDDSAAEIATAEAERREKSAKRSLRVQFSYKRQPGETAAEYQARKARHLERKRTARELLARSA